MPDMLFKFFQTTLMSDHIHQRLLISMAVDIDKNAEQIYQDTQEKIAQLIKKITQPLPYQAIEETTTKKETNQVNVDTSDEQFIQLVERAKKYIVAGDSISNCLITSIYETIFGIAICEIYRALRRVSTAPYMFYFPIENGIIIGASPETMIRVQDRQVEINPIAGMRKKNETSDKEAIEADLLSDEKECAEHMMLVDLARNDLGAVCKPGSVNVDELLQVKHFSHVSHIVSP